MKAKLGHALVVVAMVAMFVVAAGAPGSYGHRHQGKGNRLALPDTTVSRSVNWNRGGK